MLSTVRFTLFDIELGTGSLRLEYIGAANYIRAFTADIRFKTYLVETIGSLVTQIPVIVIFSLFIAVVLNQKFRGRVVVRTIFFLPVILATGILLSAESTLESAGTAIGTSDTGALAGGQDLLGNITAMLSSIGFGEDTDGYRCRRGERDLQRGHFLGYPDLYFLATLQEVPSSLYEAARVEGCDGWQSFWKINFSGNCAGDRHLPDLYGHRHLHQGGQFAGFLSAGADLLAVWLRHHHVSAVLLLHCAAGGSGSPGDPAADRRTQGKEVTGGWTENAR